ncbi:hypothetical protein B4N89_30685 [Embleya scabrispora]|uniref:Uncharacterized protein n=1 Tax=Embleya scabrispora TaxID=159449 RepID=A0A1T3P6Y5_9ACTN|nr:hypothetical protein B4N89_30685 [Embleya scabrispora]
MVSASAALGHSGLVGFQVGWPSPVSGRTDGLGALVPLTEGVLGTLSGIQVPGVGVFLMMFAAWAGPTLAVRARIVAPATRSLAARPGPRRGDPAFDDRARMTNNPHQDRTDPAPEQARDHRRSAR